MPADPTESLLTELLIGARKASRLGQGASHPVTVALAEAIAFSLGLPVADAAVMRPLREAIGRYAPERASAREALAAVAVAEACQRNRLDTVALARAVPGGTVRVLATGSYFPGEHHVHVDCGNGFGLSIGRNSGPDGHSYGGKEGLWEALPGYVTVSRLFTCGAQHWLYAHFGWRDARGWLTPADVEGIIREIAALPPRGYPVPPSGDVPPDAPRVPGCSCAHCDRDDDLTAVR